MNHATIWNTLCMAYPAKHWPGLNAILCRMLAKDDGNELKRPAPTKTAEWPRTFLLTVHHVRWPNAIKATRLPHGSITAFRSWCRSQLLFSLRFELWFQLWSDVLKSNSDSDVNPISESDLQYYSLEQFL